MNFEKRNVYLLEKAASFFLLVLCGFSPAGKLDFREGTARLMEKVGLEHLLRAPVRVCCAAEGPTTIVDEGVFFVQHTILTPAVGAEPNVVMEGMDLLNPQADKLVVAVHGWLDKGRNGGWPGRVAQAIYERVDPNQWVCAAFDWRGGARVVSSIQAAEYARDVAGPRLAAGLLALHKNFTHIHLIGHSAGSWAIHSAARRLAEYYPHATFHLTFLDAYVPSKWPPEELGTIFLRSERFQTHYWAEHYFSRDITFKVTAVPLKNAYNVDITAVAPWIADHEFPHRWYLATITGVYERWDECRVEVHCCDGDVVYGFQRGLEAGPANWQHSRTLPLGTTIRLSNRP
ncbi:MAG: hypothetical protein GX298_06985 [Planctomycetes bacterium]|nr:hypothetical protein [Planctomycetota bacterium]